MKRFCAILLILSVSLPITALAAPANFQIRIEPSEPSDGVRDFVLGTALGREGTSFSLPREIIAAADKTLSWKPVFIKNDSASLEEYLAKNFMPQPKESRQDYQTLGNYLTTQVAPKMGKASPQDAEWVEKDGRVINFKPDAWGTSFDILDLLKTTVNAVKDNRNSITVAGIKLPPTVRLDQINSHGVRELIMVGSSNFSGSSASRVKNIRVGISRFQGFMIPAGATFSFNDILGPVDGENGFAPELVIKHNGLFPEFGGGLCQVSTTVFRAALNGGLPIVERRNHSFAVQYYAPQGTDATIYPGVQDLKFTNDTPGTLLVWPTITGTTLTFSLYGQKDARKVEVGSPVRYDIKSTGAFKTTLGRKVVYSSGLEKNDTFRSSYRPKEEFTQTTTAVEPPATTPVPPAGPPAEENQI